jgi:hypothetical protein
MCGRPKGARERPQRLGRDANATSRPRRGVAAHGEAVARARRGWGAGMARLGCGARSAGAWPGLVARVHTHARGTWRPRAAAWPCRARGTGIPGPRHDAAAKGDGECGSLGGATGSCTRVAPRPDGER